MKLRDLLLTYPWSHKGWMQQSLGWNSCFLNTRTMFWSLIPATRSQLSFIFKLWSSTPLTIFKLSLKSQKRGNGQHFGLPFGFCVRLHLKKGLHSLKMFKNHEPNPLPAFDLKAWSISEMQLVINWSIWKQEYKYPDPSLLFFSIELIPDDTHSICWDDFKFR